VALAHGFLSVDAMKIFIEKESIYYM